MNFRNRLFSPLLACSLLFGTGPQIAAAQLSDCGAHTVDELFDSSLTANTALPGEHVAHLLSGFVHGKPIPDATSGMSMYRVEDEIGLIFSGGTAAGGMEFDIRRIATVGFQDFVDAGVPLEISDLGLVLGCDDMMNAPQYTGTGAILTPDGHRLPATIRLVMWIGSDEADDPIKRLRLFGFVRSEILNGNILVY